MILIFQSRTKMESCHGESGGPLMVYDFVDSRHIQVGVVQDGSGCGSKDLPGVYSRLDNPSVLNWILDKIRPFIFFAVR